MWDEESERKGEDFINDYIICTHLYNKTRLIGSLVFMQLCSVGSHTLVLGVERLKHAREC